MAHSKLQQTIDKILKDYNAGLIFGDQNTLPKFSPVSTGFPGLDLIISGAAPGLPPGRFLELFGPERAGKSTLAMGMLAEGQRLGETVVYMDVEHRIDLRYMKNLGLEINDKLVFYRPETGEEVFDVIARLIKETDAKRIVIDSVAALVAASEKVNDRGPAAQNRLGMQAAMLSQSCRVLTPVLSMSGAIVILTNQIRDNIGGYGSSEKTTGGRALRHYASTRIRISRSGANEKWGHMAKCVIKKNSVGIPDQEWIGKLVYGKGFDKMYDMISVAHTLGILQKKGAWYYHKGQQIGCGFDNVVEALQSDQETMDLILKDIKEWSE